jgi:hypothetical protein
LINNVCDPFRFKNSVNYSLFLHVYIDRTIIQEVYNEFLFENILLCDKSGNKTEMTLEILSHYPFSILKMIVSVTIIICFVLVIRWSLSSRIKVNQPVNRNDINQMYHVFELIMAILVILSSILHISFKMIYELSKSCMVSYFSNNLFPLNMGSMILNDKLIHHSFCIFLLLMKVILLLKSSKLIP